MSGPSHMLSGQAHVYLGEWGEMWGAGRHKYSQPPFGWGLSSQESGAIQRHKKRQVIFFFPLSKEPLSLLRRLVSTLYLDQLPSLIIFTVWSKTLRTAIKTEERLANKKLTASHSSSCFCHNVLIHKPVVQILHNKDDIWMACWLPLIII